MFLVGDSGRVRFMVGLRVRTKVRERVRYRPSV
jgi:hypothetical protein